MCGRFTLRINSADVAEVFSVIRQMEDEWRRCCGA